MINYKEYIKEVPNFPKEGRSFKDKSPSKDEDCF